MVRGMEMGKVQCWCQASRGHYPGSHQVALGTTMLSEGTWGMGDARAFLPQVWAGRVRVLTLCLPQEQYNLPLQLSEQCARGRAALSQP